MQKERDLRRIWRPVPTVVLTLVAVTILAWYFALDRKTEAGDAAQQAEIEKMVKQTNDLHDRVQKTEDDTRALLDPLVMLLELDRRLEANGLPPQSAREFSDRLAEENRKLLAAGLTKYIATCEQVAEVEKHLLYQGLHGPVKTLPGWSKDWKTTCKSILGSAQHDPARSAVPARGSV